MASLPPSLKRAFDSDFFSTRDEDRETYGTDRTGVVRPDPCGVAFPRSTGDVARLLELCSRERIAVVPSGGRTGLAGGATAARGELVVSLERMSHLGRVDTVARTVRVGAGAVTRAVHEHCAPHGLTWPVDFASAGSSQIGGNIATNAGGVRVVRYGTTRHWVTGLQVVTMGGEVMELNGELQKNNTGYDLRQLFIGSEGTLGVITEATLELAPLPGESRVAFLAVPGLEGALRLFERARAARGFLVLAFEYVTESCLDVVLRRGFGPHPLATPAPAYVVLEMELPASGDGAPAEAFIEALFAEGLVSDGVLAQSSKEARALWALRENISESLTREGLLHKNDVSVPVSRMPALVDAMLETFAGTYPHYTVHLFGHIGDGNLHVNIMKPADMAKGAFLATCHHADELLFGLIRAHGGSISAEHGIGILKKDFLSYSRSPAELAVFRAIKRAFDPHGLLNPGKIFDP